METNTHTRIESKKDLRDYYNKFNQQFQHNIGTATAHLEEDRMQVLQCDDKGKIMLRHEPLPESIDVVNLGIDHQTFEDATHKAKTTQDLRIVRINSVLEVIHLEIEEDLLLKLIDVVDLVDTNQGNTPIDKILELRD